MTALKSNCRDSTLFMTMLRLHGAIQPKKGFKYMKWQHENFIWSTNSWKIINVDSYLLSQISSLYIHDRIIYICFAHIGQKM
jgi:hypothetical protein